MKIRSIFIKIMLPMVLIVCFSGIAILSVTGTMFRSTYEDRIKDQNSDSCYFIAQSVESFMSRAYTVTEELAYNDAILTMDHDSQTPVVESTAERNDYFELIYIQDMKGDQTARSTGTLGNRANRWWFIQMLEENQPFVSKSYYSVNTGMACASIFIPLIREDETVGILATDIKLATLQSLVEQSSDTETGKISYIIDGEGTVVAHPQSVFYEELYNYKSLTKTVTKQDARGNTLYDAAGNILTEEQPISISDEYKSVISSVMSGKTGSAEITDNGIDYYVSYAPVKLDGYSDSWSVVTLQDKKQALSLLDRVNQNGINVTIIFILLAQVLIALITRTIIRPIKLSHGRLRLLSEGDLTTVVPAVSGKDEGAQLLNDLNNTIAILKDIIQKMNDSVKNIANGDYTQTISADFKGEFNVLASSLNKIVGSISQTMQQINSCANRFMDGLATFDEAAHSLADGTTGQASAVEELSSTLSGVSGKITQNAQNSRNADAMMLTVQDELSQSNADLETLIAAMDMIEENSKEISSISKLMQDIASKTNLLSMNAAVEAARAGEAGKGFGAVAFEVRSLAAQCNKAAADTSELIEKTRKNVQTGAESLRVMASSIQSVSQHSVNTSRLISDISSATFEQAEAIRQITLALDQISQITQRNSSTATESAETSLRMKQQAEQLKELLNRYRY